MESIATLPKNVTRDTNCVSPLRSLRFACRTWQLIRPCIEPIALPVIVIAWITAVSAAQPTAGAEALVDAFVHAWNTHDGPAFGQLCADDADWVMVSGERLKGRIAIEQALAKEHVNWARTTTLRAADVIVREIDRQRAIVMFKWESASDAERGARPYRGNSVLIVERLVEAWVIVAGQAAAVPASK